MGISIAASRVSTPFALKNARSVDSADESAEFSDVSALTSGFRLNNLENLIFITPRFYIT